MKRAFTLIEMVVVIAIVVILAAILFPVFARRNPGGGTLSSCQSNLKQFGLSFIQYTQDANEKFPPVRVSSSTGWADVLQPYCKSWQLFQCPSAPSRNFPPRTTDYFYNRRLSRVSLEKVDMAPLTILSGDGPDNAPPWSSLSQLPADAVTNSASFAQRHMDGANYGFADGHVKWLKPDKISNVSPLKGNAPTFAFH